MDKNTYLEKIHNFIENEYGKDSVRFYRNIDVLTYFETHTLANNIAKYKPQNSPMLIIINDVDSINTGRDAFPLFVNEIEKVGLNISMELRKRFKNHDYYENSEQYETKKNFFDIPENFISNYCVAISCESAQLILEVN